MKSLNDIRAEYGLPPLPPPDRIYMNHRLMKRVSELRVILNSKTLSGDFLRLEIAKRKFVKVLFYEFSPLLKPIISYLK